MDSQEPQGDAIYVPSTVTASAPASSTVSLTAPVAAGAGGNSNGNEQCPCPMGPTGLLNDNRSMLFYLFTLIAQSMILFISFIVISTDDELAEMTGSVSGIDVTLRFGMNEIETTANYFGLTHHETESYSQLCREGSDDWCELQERADAWLSFYLLGMIVSIVAISMTSSVLCCLPSGCCACDDCCSKCLAQNCCRGLCIKNTGVYCMIGVWILQIIGCCIWTIGSPLTDGDLCDLDNYYNCDFNWGSAWWMALAVGFVNLICAAVLVSRNTLRCQ